MYKKIKRIKELLMLNNINYNLTVIIDLY